MGLPLIRVDPDIHFGSMIVVMLCVLPIFLVMATFSAASMAGEDAAGGREQRDSTDQQKDGFHIFAYFVISPERSS